jgi:hypothetical protein
VYPSGIAFAAAATAIVPPAPAFASTMTACFNPDCSLEAIKRAKLSVGPPGNGLMIRIVLFGNSWADAWIEQKLKHAKLRAIK